MEPRLPLRLRPVCWIAALLAAGVPARALVRFNDGRDQIFVTGTMAFGYNSNIFSSNGGSGDTTTNYSLLVEFQRRDGYIGVNGSVGWNLGRFDKFSSQNFADPTVGLELTKEIGRTTGSLQLSAARQSTSDSAANIRTTSWAYSANLNWKYPVTVDRYTLTGAFGYAITDYQLNLALSDLSTFTAKIDMFYVFSDKRDLFGGYQYRMSTSSTDSINTDHDFHLGISGRILSKLSGNLQVGYQFRNSSASSGPPPIPASSFSSISVASSLIWPFSKRVKFSGSIKKDFSTTSTNITTDSLTGNVEADFSYNAKFSVFGTVGAGETEFLGALGAGRVDYNFSWGAGANYTYNDHFKATLAYNFIQNWSNFSNSNFESNSLTLTITSRW